MIALSSFIPAFIPQLVNAQGRVYCEYVFWRHPDQPFNFYSNLIFLAVAIAIVIRRGDLPGAAAWAIALLLTATGAASAWWHAAMTEPALIADLAASGALALLLAFLVTRFVFFWPLWVCAPALPLLYLLCIDANVRLDGWITPGSVPILPAAALLALGGIWSALVKHSNAGLYMLMAACWMAGGFLVLGLDQPACEVIPVGTHFAWHFLAAATVLCLARAVVGANVEQADALKAEAAAEEAANAVYAPPPVNEDALSEEELEQFPHGMPSDRVDPRP